MTLAHKKKPKVNASETGRAPDSNSRPAGKRQSSGPARGGLLLAAPTLGWVQPKVVIGRSNDVYERQADAVADSVAAGRLAPQITQLPAGGLGKAAQRQSEESEEEEEPVQSQVLQRQPEEEEEPVQSQVLQRQPEDEEEPVQALQRQSEQPEEEPVQSRSGSGLGPPASTGMREAAANAIRNRGTGEPLRPALRHTLESGLRADLSEVRVHEGSRAHQAAASLRAKAFTHGNHIWLGRGQSQGDLHLMAHETTHVLQQGGIVRRQPTEEEEEPVQASPDTGAAAAPVSPSAADRGQRRASVAPAPSAPAGPRASGAEPAAQPIAAASAPTAVSQRRPAVSESTQRAVAPAPAPAGSASPSPAGVPAGVTPRDQARVGAVMQRLENAAIQQEGPAANDASSRQAARAAASDASAATPSPANEASAAGQAAQVETMRGQEAGQVDQGSFLALVEQRLAQMQTPRNPDEMDRFRESGGAGALQGQLVGGVRAQADQAQGAIRGATQAQPTPGQARQPSNLPARPDEAPVGDLRTQEALPQPRPDEEVNRELEANRRSVDDQLSQENLTDERLRRANDPRFNAVREARDAVHEHADRAPAEYREQERNQLAEQEAANQAEEQAATREMESARSQAEAGVAQEQQTAMTEEEAARQEVSDHIEGIYTRVQQAVEDKLNWLDGEVNQRFTEGEQRARQAFEQDVTQGMRAWKLERYGSRAMIPVIGLVYAAGTWIHDRFVDINQFPEVQAIYDRSRAGYVDALREVIVDISNLVDESLAWCREQIENANGEIAQYVDGLPANLQAVGEQASSRVSERFDDLRGTIEQRREQLADQLVQRYQESLQALDQRIEEMQAENRGLIHSFREYVTGVLQALRNFRDRLMGILGEARGVIEEILEDPVGFIGNLVTALGRGFRQFSSNIWAHLRQGLMGWLFGSLASMGISMPTEFSLRAVVGLVMQVLGVTRDRIRAKVVRIVGERNVAVIERVWGYVSTLIREGPQGLWAQIRQDVGNLRDIVIEGIKQWVVTRIITAAVTRLVSMLNPAGAIVQAILAIYNTVMFFIERINQILDLVQSIVRSLGAIVRGQLAAAANLVERSMALTIPVIISFLARLLGIGGIATRIRRIIQRVRRRIDRAITRALRRVARRFRSLIGRGARGRGRNIGDRGNQHEHSRMIGEAITELRRPVPGASDYAALRRAKETVGRRLERRYNRSLSRGVRMRVIFQTPDSDRMDNDLDFTVRIAPNTSQQRGSLPIPTDPNKPAIGDLVRHTSGRTFGQVVRLDVSRATRMHVDWNDRSVGGSRSVRYSDRTTVWTRDTRRASQLTGQDVIRELPKDDLLRVGPYSAGSIPAQSKSQNFSEQQYRQVSDIGYQHGSHSTGNRNPGTRPKPGYPNGYFIPDHQPVSELVPDGTSQQLYPHTLSDGRRQGGQTRQAVGRLRRFKQRSS